MGETNAEKLIRWLDQLIAESERENKQKYTPPKCCVCGTYKTVDLFKGEYCPKCNDWC